MSYPQDQLDELKAVSCTLTAFSEGGFPYIRLSGLTLPEGCKPTATDMLLCPVRRDNYESRLFFRHKIESKQARNWTVNGALIAGETWFAISWQTKPGLRLAQMVAVHMGAFR